jgi:undecaprenyl-diphosphatase
MGGDASFRLATLSAMDIRSGRRDPWPLVGTLCALAFIVVATLVVRDGSLPFDDAFAARIQGLPIPREFWEACSRAGGATVFTVALVFVLVAALTGRLRLAVIVAATLGAQNLFTHVVKDYVARARPPGADLVDTSGFSFPSSHALSCTATYGLIAVVVWRSDLPRPLRLIVAVIGVTLPILVGLSRIALDVHYPSDVLAGWLAGVAFVALAATLISVTDAMTPGRLLPSREVRDERTTG